MRSRRWRRPSPRSAAHGVGPTMGSGLALPHFLASERIEEVPFYRRARVYFRRCSRSRRLTAPSEARVGAPIALRPPGTTRCGNARPDPVVLLRSWRPDYWPRWFAAAGAGGAVDTTRGPAFADHSNAVQAAIDGQGVALGRTALVGDDLLAGRLVRPFEQVIPADIAYWIVCPKGTAGRPKIAAFREWLLGEADALKRHLLADPDLRHVVEAAAASEESR